jgi:hypothetical protein
MRALLSLRKQTRRATKPGFTAYDAGGKLVQMINGHNPDVMTAKGFAGMRAESLQLVS